jgi:hypothetical protein
MNLLSGPGVAIISLISLALADWIGTAIVRAIGKGAYSGWIHITASALGIVIVANALKGVLQIFYSIATGKFF